MMTNLMLRMPIRVCAPIVISFAAAFSSAAHSETSSESEQWRQSKVVATVGSVDFRECQLKTPSYERIAQCAYLSVPENYDNPGGASIEIFIARLSSSSSKPEADAVLFIAGGPGQSTTEAYIGADWTWRKAFQQRDFYLIDQRGTGRSNIQACDYDEKLTAELQENPEEVRKALEECFANLSGDPKYYSTSVAIKDFEQVRQALEIPQWNLFGASYGTRVEQHYMRQYSESIRSVILDAVIHMQASLGPDIPLESQAALEVLYARCGADTECAKQFPNFKKGVEGLFKSLEENPKQLRFENLRSGTFEEMKYSKETLAAQVRMALYNTDGVSILPPLLFEAFNNDNFAPLARNALLLEETFGQLFAMGMHNSVMCTEDVPFFDEAKISETNYDHTYMGKQILDLLKMACGIWPRGVIDDGFKDPVKSDIPTLLLSGEFYPITPPAYAEIAKEYLTNSVHFVMPGQGHGVSWLGCAPTMVAKFIDEASVENLNDDCFKRMKAAPVFIDFNGSSP